MKIPRKPSSKNIEVEKFIEKGSAQKAQRPVDEKTGRRIISFSLMSADADWLNLTIDKINPHSQRKITRSELISAAVSILKEKTTDDIIQIIKSR